MIHQALPHGLSDHCPLLLLIDEENWGPCPQRMLKCWTNLSDYHKFVKDQWPPFQVTGWGGYILKEKLKLI